MLVMHARACKEGQDNRPKSESPHVLNSILFREPHDFVAVYQRNVVEHELDRRQLQVVGLKTQVGVTKCPLHLVTTLRAYLRSRSQHCSITAKLVPKRWPNLKSGLPQQLPSRTLVALGFTFF